MFWLLHSCLINLPHTTPPSNDSVEEIKFRASQALNNINSLYNEIMSPKEFIHEEVKIIDLDTGCQKPKQGHYLKTCCTTLKELCAGCHKFISKCSSCNKCNCNITLTKESYENDFNGKSLEHPNNFKVNITIPKPFSFFSKIAERQKVKESKICKLKEEIINKVEEELSVRAQVKPVPKHTHLPIYKKMVEENERQKMERKKTCHELLNFSKPFNLHTSKLPSKAKSSSDLRSEKVFKAKPAPKHILSEKVSQKIKSKEEIRRMLITERAKSLLQQSTSPFSKRTLPYSQSLINLNDFSHKCKTKHKNISEITNRLYVKKCSETIDYWNKKVQQVDICKKLPLLKEQNYFENEFLFKKLQYKPEEMPFLFFPMRMSNAAVLREKQIRDEISRQKMAEEKKKYKGYAKKKINANIVNQLKNLNLTSSPEKEIEEKVKNFRQSQIKREEEYEEELQEIMKRVSERQLLIERQSKVIPTKILKSASNKSIFSDKESTISSKCEELTGFSSNYTNTNVSQSSSNASDS